MEASSIIIWGAGRIGRGFIGDIFHQAGVQLVFIDESESLINQLLQANSYTVVRAKTEDNIERATISGFRAYHTGQGKEIQEEINNTSLIALAVYPQNFEKAAQEIARYLIARKVKDSQSPINIIVCTNLVHAGPIFKDHLYKGLTSEQSGFFDDKVGIIESLVIRIAPDPPSLEKEKDPLVVWTNGYPELPVEREAFKGEIPKLSSLRLVKDMRAEEMRKIYTYNMCHAVLSYHGHMMGYSLLIESLADSRIRREAEGALQEVSEVLQKEYGFTQDEMTDWIKGVIEQTDNPTVGDTVQRSAADPMRKLRREDRLIGPTLLCLKNEVKPYFLIRAISAAFHYHHVDDDASRKLQEMIKQKGLSQTIIETCGFLASEKEIVQQIEKEYKRVALETEWNIKALDAYKKGFEYELKYHGCGQSVIAAVGEVLGMFDDEVFNSATGLCGGIGLVNDAGCSALTAGAMCIGLVFPRNRKNFDGDRENKYRTFRLVQSLRERFLNEYGGSICAHVHKIKFGKPFDLREKEERDAFEEAGGHSDFGCTQVVGNVAKWTVELLADEIISLEMDKAEHG
jgi:mannitol-1-phosphate 5-dehydrogenase